MIVDRIFFTYFQLFFDHHHHHHNDYFWLYKVTEQREKKRKKHFHLLLLLLLLYNHTIEIYNWPQMIHSMITIMMIMVKNSNRNERNFGK